MKLSREGAMELIGHEAIVLTRYLDSVGVWTLGVGHTKMAGPPNPETYLGTLTVKEAFDLFMLDVQKYVEAVNAAVKVKVTQEQFDALVSFHFNTGAIGRASLVKKLNAGDLEGAAAGFMAWSKPPEIIGRRTKERDLFSTGRYSNRGMADIYPATSEGKILWGKPKRVDLRSLVGGAVIPPPPDIPKPIPKPGPTPKPGNIGGAIGSAVVLGGGVIIANETSKKGADTGQIAMVVGLSLVIALAVFLIVRQLFKRN